MDKGSCPASVVVVEPILDALSAMIPCDGALGGTTHYLFMPITFKFYLKVKSGLPRSDTVVCIGCDSHYGPNRMLLETSFQKPYKLFLEYPTEYVHNAAFRKMMGKGKWSPSIDAFMITDHFRIPLLPLIVLQKSPLSLSNSKSHQCAHFENRAR